MCGPPAFAGALSAAALALLDQCHIGVAEGPGGAPELSLAGVDAAAGRGSTRRPIGSSDSGQVLDFWFDR